MTRERRIELHRAPRQRAIGPFDLRSVSTPAFRIRANPAEKGCRRRVASGTGRVTRPLEGSTVDSRWNDMASVRKCRGS